MAALAVSSCRGASGPAKLPSCAPSAPNGGCKLTLGCWVPCPYAGSSLVGCCRELLSGCALLLCTAAKSCTWEPAWCGNSVAESRSAGLAKDARGSCAARGLLVKTRAAKGLLDGLDGTSRKLRSLSGAGCLKVRLNASREESSSGTAAPVALALSIIKLAVAPQALPHIMQCHSPRNATGGMPATDLGIYVPYTPYMRAAADPSPVFCEPSMPCLATTV